MANTVWELASLLGTSSGPVDLRMAVWEWNAYREAASFEDAGSTPEPEIVVADVDRTSCGRSGGDLALSRTRALRSRNGRFFPSRRADHRPLGSFRISALTPAHRLPQRAHSLAVSAANVPIYGSLGLRSNCSWPALSCLVLRNDSPPWTASPSHRGPLRSRAHGPSFEEWSFA